MPKALLLLSGGLDSTLAGKALLDLGVEVEALNFTSPFCRCTPKGFGCSAARLAADRLGIPIRHLVKGEDYFEVVKHPRHGRGQGMNPCIDCRIFTFRKAGELMRETGADFVATGEVLGQRPMSQRRPALERIEAESGLVGRVVRPLSARLLEPSIPEKEGLIDRNRLLAIQGRSRREQMALADESGLTDYPCPAGGCLLTDLEFAARLRELLEREPDASLDDARLLALGRHFRLPGGGKAVVGRHASENGRIAALLREGDFLLAPVDVPGPVVLLRPPPGADKGAAPDASASEAELAAGLAARYTQAGGATVKVRLHRAADAIAANNPAMDGGVPDTSQMAGIKEWEAVPPATEDLLNLWRIGAGERK